MRILYLPHRVPFPPDKGDRIRSYHLLKFLAGLGTVDLATLADEAVHEDTHDELRELCNKFEIVPVGKWRWASGALSWLQRRTITEGLFRSHSLAACIREWTSECTYDAVVVICSSMSQYLKLGSRIPETRIVDLIDVDSQKWTEYAETSSGWRRFFYASEAARLREVERTIPGRVNAVTLVSESEVKLFQRFSPAENVYAVCNGVDLDYFRPASDATVQPNSAAFVGALDYAPNVDGLLWYSQHVWPSLRRKHPDAVLRVVGRRPNATVRGLDKIDGIEVVGEVADVRPFVRSSQIVIAPLRIARGVQNKVLEALAMGKPVVASAEALTGIALTPDVHAKQVSSPEDWTSMTSRLWCDNEACARLGSAGRAFVERHHSWEACLSPFQGLLGVACEGRETVTQRQDASVARLADAT